MRFRLLASGALLALGAGTVPAQNATIPERPRLPSSADTNDADAYFKYGMHERTPWKKAFPAFYWARRLNPSQPLYAFALYNAAWGRQSREWRNMYFDGATFIVKSKEAALIDSLQYDALIRDPFAHFTGCVMGEWYEEIEDPALAGLVYFESQCYKQAAEKLALGIKERPKNLGLRLTRAKALHFSGQYGNAIAELQGLIQKLNERDEKQLRRVYESKEMFEYMLGLTHLQNHEPDLAKEAFGRALMENLAFYPAHQKLALVALAQQDVETAINELALAIQAKPDDPGIRLDYGYALLQMGETRYAEAEEQFRKAIELEPHFSLAYYNLAIALEKQGKKSEALEQYRAYLARAPRNAENLNNVARAKLTALASSAP